MATFRKLEWAEKSAHPVEEDSPCPVRASSFSPAYVCCKPRATRERLERLRGMSDAFASCLAFLADLRADSEVEPEPRRLESDESDRSAEYEPRDE